MLYRHGIGVGMACRRVGYRAVSMNDALCCSLPRGAWKERSCVACGWRWMCDGRGVGMASARPSVCFAVYSSAYRVLGSTWVGAWAWACAWAGRGRRRQGPSRGRERGRGPDAARTRLVPVARTFLDAAPVYSVGAPQPQLQLRHWHSCAQQVEVTLPTGYCPGVRSIDPAAMHCRRDPLPPRRAICHSQAGITGPCAGQAWPSMSAPCSSESRAISLAWRAACGPARSTALRFADTY